MAVVLKTTGLFIRLTLCDGLVIWPIHTGYRVQVPVSCVRSVTTFSSVLGASA
jgi:hypothetical protein